VNVNVRKLLINSGVNNSKVIILIVDSEPKWNISGMLSKCCLSNTEKSSIIFSGDDS
jgi:hypothetical protein